MGDLISWPSGNDFQMLGLTCSLFLFGKARKNLKLRHNNKKFPESVTWTVNYVIPEQLRESVTWTVVIPEQL
jgi:hypothetical protein